MKEYKTDILIVGGGFGGVAAALAACKAGYRVIMTEETDWIGGQATAQGVPLDEHPWIEQYGAPLSYRNFRDRIRSYYKRNYTLSQNAHEDQYFNPGACWVSALGFEPRIGVHVLEEMLAPYRSAGLLNIWLRTEATQVFETDDRITAVSFFSTIENVERIVLTEYVLDATELGDLLELGGIEHIIGAESKKETGEPLALDEADPLKQQPFTHLIALERRSNDDVIIVDKPKDYEIYRPIFGKVIAQYESLRIGDIVGLGMPNGVFARNEAHDQYNTSLWNFRRYFYHGNFDTSFFLSDLTAMMVGNEYTHGVLCGVSNEEREKHLSGARDLSLSLVHYLQTEVPCNGSMGIEGLSISTSVFDSDDGLAKYPYIRESRRIKALYTIKEQDFLISENPSGAKNYFDTVGVAGYRIDIHEKAKNREDSITAVCHGQHWTQQIPLGSLIPVRVRNLIPCGKNIGTTHVTNGSFRLHPVEWNIGEVAGSLAAFCLRMDEWPEGVRNTPRMLEKFQKELIQRGVELHWPSQNFGMSYFSHHRNVESWYFGECDKLGNSRFRNQRIKV